MSKIIKNGTELGFLHEAGRCVYIMPGSHGLKQVEKESQSDSI